jgi:hypothetical protein
VPSLAELLGGVAILATLAGGFEYVQVLQRDKTIAAMQLAAKQAQIDQDNKDAALNAKIAQASQDKITAIRAAVAAALQKVASDAPTNTCGPSVRDAVRSLQHSNAGSGAASPGR